MKYLVFLLALSSSAMAQELSSAGTCVSQDGSVAWTSTEAGCRRDGGVFHPLVVGSWSPPITGTVTGMNSSVFITNSPSPKCPDGYSSIFRSTGSPACARDIIDPQ